MLTYFNLLCLNQRNSVSILCKYVADFKFVDGDF